MDYSMDYTRQRNLRRLFGLRVGLLLALCYNVGGVQAGKVLTCSFWCLGPQLMLLPARGTSVPGNKTQNKN